MLVHICFVVVAVCLFVCLFVYSFVNFFIALGDCFGVGSFVVVVVVCFSTDFFLYLFNG